MKNVNPVIFFANVKTIAYICKKVSDSMPIEIYGLDGNFWNPFFD